MTKGLNVILLLWLLTGISAQVFSQNDNDLFTVVEIMPSFPGGQPALERFLQENLRYPPAAYNNGIQGVVYARFVVNTDGSLGNPQILKGPGSGLNEEVLRVIGIMPSWIPGKQDGKPVKVLINLPVKFKL